MATRKTYEDRQKQKFGKKRIKKDPFIILEVILKPVRLLFVLDIVFRALFISLYVFGKIGHWAFGASYGIPLIVFGILKVYTERKFKKSVVDKIPSALRADFNQVIPGFKIKDTLAPIYVLLGFVVTFLFFHQVIAPEHWYTYIIIFILSVFGMAMHAILPELINIPRSYDPVEFKVVRQIDKNNVTISSDVSTDFVSQLISVERIFDDTIEVSEADTNDLEITRLESELKNLTSRVDSYQLESVLIGSLTFSGFLTIVAEGRVLDRAILSDLVNQFSNVPYPSSSSVSNILMRIETFSTDVNLLSIILIESLFCSVFFVLVLGLRLRFGRLSLNLDHLIRIMANFNAKEEELINIEMAQGGKLSEMLSKRKRTITHRISETISDAKGLIKNIRPVVRLMTFYRSIGLFIFLIILITSGLFFSVRISFFIFLLAAATWCYRIFEERLRFEKIRQLLNRHW